MPIFRLHQPGQPDASSFWASARTEKEARARAFNAMQFERYYADPAAVLGRAYDCSPEPGRTVRRCGGRPQARERQRG